MQFAFDQAMGASVRYQLWQEWAAQCIAHARAALSVTLLADYVPSAGHTVKSCGLGAAAVPLAFSVQAVHL